MSILPWTVLLLMEMLIASASGVVDTCNAYLQEAKWYYSCQIPTLKEYMNNTWVSIAAPALITCAYCSSECIANQALQEYEFDSDMVQSSSIIFRLLDDLETSSSELRRGDVPKSIQCYMFENCVSETVARECIRQKISEQWKILNSFAYRNMFT